MPYWTKYKWIAKFVRGKKVLDLGCVNYYLGRSDYPWLHGLIRGDAASVVGVDVLDDEVEKLRRQGFHVVCANVETMRLNETFDVVVAGDIIEHLSNFGLFLERTREHLVPGGLLLVTTPNPVNLLRFVRVLLQGRVPANKEHTCWFTCKTLKQLARRHGFEVQEEAYVDDSRMSYRLWRALPARGGQVRRALRRAGSILSRLPWQPAVWLNSLLCLLRPRLSETLCVALRRA